MNKLSKESIKKIKARHGNDLRLIKPQSADKEFEFIAKKPNRHIVCQWEKYVDKDPLKARKILIDGCLVTEDEDALTEVKKVIKESDELFLSISNALVGLITFPEATVENL